MKKSTAKKLVKIDAANAPTVRKRRTLRPRAARSYYAMSDNGQKLYRFSSHYEREFFVKKGEVEVISAMDFRIRILEDVQNKLQVIDVRGQFPQQNVNLEHLGVASSSRDEAPKLSGDVIENLTNVFRTTIEEVLSKAQGADQIRGEGEPRITRLNPQH